ncbi:TonB-dependent receptor family protein [Capnocytophaga stomatis]|uniref:TonB-dependent receptor family protein n=1 Tax=Capnocytophaga stomatis TaxID=1848904 RepID=UPI0019514220|nr:TonB-dependent receptor [Capnocytophaga stomatis]
MCRYKISSLMLCFAFGSLFAQEKEQKKDSIQQLEEVVISTNQILGSKFQARNRTGSAYYISPAEIQKLGYTDINRMLKAVPGVNVYEEDGYGLRPNISLRGTKAERSEKITLMEDGILAAPAPYSAPAAYYFPNAARMSAVEVLKGSSQVQYGPFTTGGAINMVSTPIPAKRSGKFNASYGVNNTYKAHVNFGDTRKHIGYLVEYLRFQSDGFKKFADDQRAGFKRNDFIAKFIAKTDKEEGVNHSVEFKFGYANEDSDETYVGLSEADFKINPYLRYAGSRVDNITTKHQQWVATYVLNISSLMKITTNAYYNTFHRNWYKLNDVRVGITSAEKRSVGQVLDDPETNHLYFDVLTGKTDYIGEGLIVRANNRDYFSRGIQTKFDYHFYLGNAFMDVEAGLRYHADAEDRFQWDDGYSIKGGQMQLFLAGIHGTQANRITSANALATYLLSKITYRSLTVSAGLRYEDVDLHKKDYTKADVRRSGKIRREVDNQARVLIPSLGLHYKLTRSLSVFSGIHKGFSPPSAGLNQKHESSINWELGSRLNTNNFTAEVIGFYNAYSNMLGSDLAAAGGSGTLEQFDVGEAMVRGAEVMLHYQPIPAGNALKLPLQLSYTYTDTEMLNSFEENTWGRVFVGDEIPYINKHSFNASLGAEYKGFELNIGVRYNGDMRTVPGQGVYAERNKVPAHTIIDASAKARINKYLTLTVNAVNITNKTYLVSRHPAGLRPGHPFGVYSGVIAKF